MSQQNFYELITLNFDLAYLHPAWTPSCTHEVVAQENDTCATLAATWNITVSDLIQDNDNLDEACDNLVPGQQVRFREPAGIKAFLIYILAVLCKH